MSVISKFVHAFFYDEDFMMTFMWVEVGLIAILPAVILVYFNHTTIKSPYAQTTFISLISFLLALWYVLITAKINSRHLSKSAQKMGVT